MAALEYPPHFTLAVYDEISRDELVRGFNAAIGELPRLAVTFDSFGYFETSHSIVLWAKPRLPSAYFEFHGRFHSLVNVNDCRPNYRPGIWAPHCTLATAIPLDRRGEVVELTKQRIDPFEVKFDMADCVSFMPVEVIHEKELSKV